MANNRTPFFRCDGEYFVGTDSSRSPWGPDVCHAGPPTGLFAREAENSITGKRLVRLDTNYVRPVPMDGIRIDSEVVRDGRVATTLSLSMFGRSGKICGYATTTHIIEEDIGPVPSPDLCPPKPSMDEPEDFVFKNAPHGKPFFANAVETKYPPGFRRGTGPKTIWMRTPVLLEGEDMSPFQSVCPMADCGNGISFNVHPREFSCINPNVSLTLHREPESEWLASQAISHWHSDGIGMSHAILYDEKGEIGVAIQPLVLRPL